MLFNKQKKLGQVFLKNEEALEKIIKTGEINSQNQVLEIGPGKGALTEGLLRTGAKIIAVEKDPELVKFLKNKFKNQSNLKIVHADIRDSLQSDNWHEEYNIENKEYKVIGNIPYYLTSHLIQLLLESRNQPEKIVLMIQKEVAQRLISQPPKMNLLAASVQFYAKPEIICYVSKDSFSPEPKVDSVGISSSIIQRSCFALSGSVTSHTSTGLQLLYFLGLTRLFQVRSKL